MRIMTSLCICDLVKLHYNHNLTLRIFNHIYLPMHMQLWGLPPNPKGTDTSVGGVGAGEKCMELPSTAALQPQVLQKKQGNIPSQPQKESYVLDSGSSTSWENKHSQQNKNGQHEHDLIFQLNWWMVTFFPLSLSPSSVLVLAHCKYPTRTAPSLPLSHLMWSMLLLVGHH